MGFHTIVGSEIRLTTWYYPGTYIYIYTIWRIVPLNMRLVGLGGCADHMYIYAYKILYIMGSTATTSEFLKLEHLTSRFTPLKGIFFQTWFFQCALVSWEGIEVSNHFKGIENWWVFMDELLPCSTGVERCDRNESQQSAPHRQEFPVGAFWGYFFTDCPRSS